MDVRKGFVFFFVDAIPKTKSLSLEHGVQFHVPVSKNFFIFWI